MVEYYNFKANTLEISDGTLTTDSSNYSTSPSGSSQSTDVGSQQTTAADSQQTAAAADSQQAATVSGEYDDVPKTGESQTAVPLLIGAAFVCMLGSLWLRKRAAHNA